MSLLYYSLITIEDIHTDSPRYSYRTKSQRQHDFVLKKYERINAESMKMWGVKTYHIEVKY